MRAVGLLILFFLGCVEQPARIEPPSAGHVAVRRAADGWYVLDEVFDREHGIVCYWAHTSGSEQAAAISCVHLGSAP